MNEKKVIPLPPSLTAGKPTRGTEARAERTERSSAYPSHANKPCDGTANIPCQGTDGHGVPLVRLSVRRGRGQGDDLHEPELLFP